MFTSIINGIFNNNDAKKGSTRISNKVRNKVLADLAKDDEFMAKIMTELAVNEGMLVNMFVSDITGTKNNK